MKLTLTTPFIFLCFIKFSEKLNLKVFKMTEFCVDAQKIVAYVCVISVLFFILHDNPKDMGNS